MAEKISRKTFWAIVALSLVSFAGIVSETSMNVTFVALMKQFNVTLGLIQWITTFYLFVVACLMTTSSFLKERFTIRQIFFTAVINFVLGGIICALAPNFWILLLGRVFQGIATGLATPALFNLILERIPRSVIGLWMGIASLILSIAPSIGPTFGGLLVDTAGWRWIFIILLVLPIIALFLGIKTIEDTPRQFHQQLSFDALAFSLLAITLFASLMTLNSLEGGKFNVTYVVIFAIGLALFIWRARVSKQKFLNLTIFKNPFFTLSLLAYGLYQFANIGINFVIPNFLQSAQGATSIEAGFALLPGSLIGALNNPMVGRLYDKRGPKLGVYGGNLLWVATLVIMTIFTKSLAFIPMTIAYIFFTLGRNMPFATLNTNTLDNLGSPEEKADANAIFQTTQQFLGAVATTIGSLMLSNAPTSTSGTQWFLLMLLVFGILNFGYFVLIFKKQPARQ